MYSYCKSLKTVRLPHSAEEIAPAFNFNAKWYESIRRFAIETALTDIYYNGTKRRMGCNYKALGLEV